MPDRSDEELELREERLNVATESAPAGEVAVQKEVVTESRTVSVPAIEEQVVIESWPADDATVGEAHEIGAGEVRVQVYADRVRVEKRLLVTSEIALSKDSVEEHRQIAASLRREEPRLETRGEANVKGDIAE